MGYYFSCDYRAALDRAIHEHLASPEVEQLFALKEASPSPHADLGTGIHYTMMDGMGCTFGPDAKPPEPSTWLNAATLFGNDLTKTKAAAFRSATLAAAHMPKLADPNMRWLAEIRVRNRWTQGTIDFLEPVTGAMIGDLKSTSKPPLGGNIKAPHLYQLLTYRWLDGRRAKRGFVIYVDSINASWAQRIDLDFTDPAFEELTDHIVQYTKYLRSQKLMQMAVPRLGTHCSDDWCPYTTVCKARFLKPLSQGFSHAKPLPTSQAASLEALGRV